MLRKEFYDAFRKLIESLLVLLAIPLAYILDIVLFDFSWTTDEIVNYVFIITVFVYVLYSGSTILNSEKKNRAFEYLFSWPLPRWKMILYKILSRLAFLVLLLFISLFFSIFKNFFIDGFNLIVLFFITIFLSIAVRAIILNIIGVLFTYLVYYFTSTIIKYLVLTSTSELQGYPASNFLLFHLLPAVLLLIPLGTAFWITFKNLDLKPLKLQLKPFIYISIPTVLILVSFISIFYKGYIQWLIRH